MADALDMLENLKALDPTAIARKTIDDNELTMEGMMEQQLWEGKRSDGTDILPDYSELTIAIKEVKGQPVDRVTLKDESDFYDGLDAELKGDEITFTSKDSKTAKLEKKYSTAKGSIFGLTEENHNELVEAHLRPEWEAAIENQTGLKFT